MNHSDEQEQTPFLDALIDYVESDPAPFDVPGHKLGNFANDLSRKISPLIYEYDCNAPIGLDNLYNPNGVIKEAEALAAKAMKADHCLFSVNGTTGGILSMFLGCLDAKDKIILPRNSHKSVINGLIISGAVPIFVDTFIDEELGIACGMRSEDVIQAMDENPTVKAVFVINPTYFGVASDLKTICEEAHRRGLFVMVDEAHGSEFYFSDHLPLSAMEAGADISVLSMHKNSGSLTQTSMILTKGDRVNFTEVKKAYAMLSSTSPNHLLLASLDAARKEMALHGKELIENNLALAAYARKKLNQIRGIHVYGEEYVSQHHNSGVFAIDPTKLVIKVTDLGFYGYDVYRLIRKESNVQLELGEVSVVLACLGPGTIKEHVDKLVQAFEKLSDENYETQHTKEIPVFHYAFPKMVVPPREGYDAPHKIITLEDSVGEISAETVMAYPPGIPLVIPGEMISAETIRMIRFYMEEGGEVLKDTEQGKIKIIDRDKWYLSDDFPGFTR